MNRFRVILGTSLVAITTILAAGSASAQDESDSTIQGYEANQVHLTMDSGNRVLEVRVKGCELCTKKSYLPTRDITISEGSRELSSDDYQRISGNSGTIMFDDRNDMVFEVNFWLQRGEGDVR